MHPLLTGRFSRNHRVGNQRSTPPLRGRRIIHQQHTVNLLDVISRPPLLAAALSVCDRNPTIGDHRWVGQLQRRGQHLYLRNNLPAMRSRLACPMSCLQDGIGQRHRAVEYSSTLPRTKHNGSDRLKLRFRLLYLCPSPMELGWGLLPSQPLRQGQLRLNQVLDRKVCAWGLRQSQPRLTQVSVRKVCAWGLIQSQPLPLSQPRLSQILRRRVYGWEPLQKQPLS
jgi:hypothetical protein